MSGTLCHSNEEWSFAAPYPILMSEDAPQRRYELREMFNALRWMARAGASWCILLTNFPPWELVCQRTQRWLNANCFEAMVNDLCSALNGEQSACGGWADAAQLDSPFAARVITRDLSDRTVVFVQEIPDIAGMLKQITDAVFRPAW